MSKTNVDQVSEALALYRREGFAALAGLASPEIEIRMGSGPNKGDYHGIDQGLEFNADWEEAWATMSYEVAEIEPVDDEHVIARIEMLMLGEGSGAEVRGTQWWLFGLRDGRFFRWHLYDDREQALDPANRR